MSKHIHPALRNVDGMAVIGRTLHDLMGVRYDEGEGGNAPAVTPTPAAPAAPAVAAAAPAAPAEPATPAVEKVEDLPAWAQKIITDTRKEAADSRIAKKAEEDRVAAILKAAGIKTDEPDPVAVAKSATDAATKATRELAVFKAAATAGADPTKLLDRASFLSSIQGIDPADGSAITAAIKAAVDADASLKTVRAAGASGSELTGSGETGQMTEAQYAQIKNDPAAIIAAQKAGQLRNILGG